jgi:beta-glucanase (GH16 family)
MKKIIVCLLICSFGSFSLVAQCYQLVWADEFGGSALDLTKWTPVVGEGAAVSGNAELQYYTARPDNIAVSGGTLKIIAKLESYGGDAYTSARMQTKNIGDWKYGRIESRIKLPTAVGMWPAFWMLPTDNVYGTWPNSGEMDIMELIGVQPGTCYGTIHTHNGAAVQSFGGNYVLPSSGVFSSAFHIFSMEWSPNLINFYMDGILYYTQSNTTVAPYPWVFDQRFFILLNLAIGGSWGGAPNATTNFPQVMEVDYVRVYQKIANFSISGSEMVQPNTSGLVYSLPSVAGTTYNWSVSGSGVVVSGQNTNQVVVNWGSVGGSVSAVINDGCSAAATATKPVSVTSNLWVNPDFEANYNNWETRPTASSSVANFNISTTDFAQGSKAACVQINTVGTNIWDIQLSRINLSLVAGTTYTLSFKAKSDVARTVPVAFIRSSNFSQVAYQTKNLTTSWQTYTMSFTPASNENVMCNLDLAAQTGTVCFDDFVFYKSALPLPLELLSFDGVYIGGGVQLNWRTAGEIGIRDFEVERSQNGSDFEVVGRVACKNLGGGDYQIIDKNPFSGVNYYRLKIWELGGGFNHSKVVAVVKKSSSLKIVVSPSVVSDILKVSADGGELTEVVVVNQLGEVVGVGKSNGYDWQLNCTGLASGVYFVRATGLDGVTGVVKFMKK